MVGPGRGEQLRGPSPILRKRSLSIALVLLMVVSASPPIQPSEPVEAASPMGMEDNAILRFDMGRRDGPVMSGWTQVQGGLLYSRGAGYGWDVAHQDFYNTRRPPEISPYVIQRSWVIDRYGSDMTVDGVRDEGPMTFSADIANGEYRVRVTLGDLFYPVYSMNVTAEGRQVASELAAFHLVHRSVYMKDARGNWANYGMPLPHWFSVTVEDGVLDITFDGSDDLFWDRMDQENATAPPESYLTAMSTGGVKQGGVNPPYRFIGGPHTMNSVLGIEVYPARNDLVTVGPTGLALDPSVTNASVVAAVDQYNSATSQLEYDVLGASVLEMLYDHETGELADLKALEELMAHLQGSLDADIDPVHLTKRIDGLMTLLLRNPRDQTLWEVLNQTERLRTALDFIFHRVQTGKNHFYENSKAASVLWSFQPDDPLYDCAEMWRARALYMLDPHRWTSASGTAADIMEALRPKDPDNPYITMYRDTVPGGGRIWEEGQRVVTTTGKVDHWTETDVNRGWEEAPQWARWLREELYWLYDITDWWVLNRQQPDGALGGGWSDDVEFIGLFGFDALISQGADDLSLVGARRFVDGMLASGGVDLERGYSTALADAEHTAEWTGDSLPMMIAVDYGNPKWVEFSYKTGVLMRDLWMGETDLGHTHFRSNYLSATRIGGPDTAEDAWINYRAALPAHWVGWYNGDPEVERLFVDWATAWVEDAMRTDDGKPRGVFPASVGFANDELGGHNSPNWYTAQHPAGTVNYDWQPQQYKGYLEELVRGAYEATGNLSLLEPFKLEAQLAQDYLDDPVPSPTPGSAAWAGMVLGSAAIERWDRMRMDYGIEGGGGMSGEPNGFTPEDVIGMTRAGRRYIDMCLPLMTTEASATDRVAFVGIINPFMIYTGGGVGGALLAPKVTYTGLGRNFAACVMDARTTGLKVLMYSFHPETVGAGLVLWELENGGTYRVTVGDDTDGDGEVDVVDYTGTFEYLAKGQKVPIQLPGSAEKLVVVDQVEEGSGSRALLQDLALTAEDVSANEATGTLDVVVHNIGANTTGNFSVVVRDPMVRGDWIIGTARTGPLDPPADLLPSTTVVGVSLSMLPVTDEVTVELIPVDGGPEITTLNNRVLARVNSSLLLANGAPSYAGPIPITPVEVPEDPLDEGPVEVLSLMGLFEDPDGDALRFEVDASGDGAGNVTLEILNGSVLLIDITKDWNGNVTFLIRAWDSGHDGVPGNEDDLYARTPDVTLFVLPVNDPPEFTGPPEGGRYLESEDTPLDEPYHMADATVLFSDVDGDVLSYSLNLVEGGEHVELELVDGVLTWLSVEEDWFGNVTFEYVAADAGPDGVPGNGDDATATSPAYALVVRPVNDPPYTIGEIPRGTFGYDDHFEMDLAPYFGDVDGDALYFVISIEPEGVMEAVVLPYALPDPTDLLVITMTDEEWYGYATVNVTVYDRDPSGSAEQPLTASLEFVLERPAPEPPPDRPPVVPLISVDPEEPVVGDEVTFDVSEALDPEGKALTFLWRLDGLLLADWSDNPSIVHVFDGPGSYNVSVSVMDVAGLTNGTWTVVQVEEEQNPQPQPPPPNHADDHPVLWIVVAAAVVIVLVGLGAVLFLKRRGEL